MSTIVYDPNFNPNSNLTSLDSYNGLIKNAPFEPTFSIDPSTGKITSAATISPYNKVRIEGYTFPGSSTVSITREKKVTIEKGKKGAGNKVVDTGIDLAKVSIDTHLFNDNDLSDFQDILDFFEQRKGLKASPTGFVIFHPACVSRGVKSVYLEGIEGPMYEGGKTIYKSRWVEVVKVKKVATKNIDTPKQTVNNGPELQKQNTEKYGNNNAVPPSQDPKNTKPKTQPQPKRTPS